MDSSVSSDFLRRSGQGRGSTRSNLRQNLVRTADNAMVVAPSHVAFCQHLPRILCSISIVFHSTGRFIINHQTLPWRSKLQPCNEDLCFSANYLNARGIRDSPPRKWPAPMDLDISLYRPEGIGHLINVFGQRERLSAQTTRRMNFYGQA